MNTLKLIDEYLYENDIKKEDDKVMSSHHPSSISSCMRALYYRWIKAPITDPRTATDAWRMELGKWLHLMYADHISKTGMKVENEVEVTYKDPRLRYPIHGYIDGIIDNRIGIELKTTFGYGAKAIQISGKPREQDEAQAKVYLSIRKDLECFNIPYLARDSFYRTEFIINMSPQNREDYLNSCVDKFERLEKYVSQGALPNREYSAVIKDGEIKDSIQHKGVKYKSDWVCMYCIRRSLCWKPEIESMDIILPMESK